MGLGVIAALISCLVSPEQREGGGMRPPKSKVRAVTHRSAVANSSTIAYAILLILAPVVGLVFAHFSQSWNWTVYGRPPYVVLFLIVTGLTLILWFLAEASQARILYLWVFIAILIVIWVIDVGRYVVDGLPTTLTWLTLPTLLILIGTKTPNRRNIEISLHVVSWFIVSAAALTAFAEVLGLLAPSSDSVLRFMSGFGLFDNRWSGPFGSLVEAGFAGVLVFIVGLSRSTLHSAILSGFGLLIVLYSESRSAIAAVFTCSALYLVFAFLRQRSIGRNKASNIVRAKAALVTLVTVVALLLVTLNPSSNGRFEIWAGYFAVFKQTPIFGVGQSGISSRLLPPGVEPANNAGTIQHLPSFGVSGHNVFIDALARGGLLLLIPTSIFLLLSVIVAFKGIRHGTYIGPSLILGIFTLAMFDGALNFLLWSAADAAYVFGLALTLQSLMVKTLPAAVRLKDQNPHPIKDKMESTPD